MATKDFNNILLNCSLLCNNSYRAILANLKSETTEENETNAYKLETKLWTEVIKYKDANDLNVIQYLHGFYVMLLQTVNLTINSRRRDPYFITSPPISRTASKSDQLLVYNILIRLGDLNRYLRNPSLAKAYYSRARDLNPYRGHAYNQLALIALNDGMKSIYYYVRAVLASEEPFTIAENNLKFAVNRFSITAAIIKTIFDGESLEEIDPTTINNWLFVVVIAIYAKNIKVVLNSIIFEAVNWFRVQTVKSPQNSPKLNQEASNSARAEDLHSILPGLDLLLDFLLTAQNFDTNITDYENTFMELKCEADVFLSQNVDLITLQTDRSKALSHDYILLGFSPLKSVHEQLKFEDNCSESKGQQIILVSRISEKSEKLLSTIKERKQSKTKKSRNIALQSILNTK
ncbi:hypothetical protein B4U80_13049 [Leptotrombidium deliense]|uniref:DNA/RNA-binding domain-containing protein n=1 Tax=Leptotrombidium deliense TaxID=299467 RepID=A0A443SE23_9ACAR|nr:hypothetical protein B4U80_13049 [Leptotrombidium deliense]